MVLMAVVGGDLKLLFVLLLQPVCMCVWERMLRTLVGGPEKSDGVQFFNSFQYLNI